MAANSASVSTRGSIGCPGCCPVSRRCAVARALRASSGRGQTSSVPPRQTPARRSAAPLHRRSRPAGRAPVDRRTPDRLLTADLTAGKFGEPLPSVTPEELASFRDGLDAFLKQETVRHAASDRSSTSRSAPSAMTRPRRSEGPTSAWRRGTAGGSPTAVSTPSPRRAARSFTITGSAPVAGLQLRTAEVVPPEANVVAGAEDPAGVRPRPGGCHARFGLPGAGRFAGPRGAGGGGPGGDGDRPGDRPVRRGAVRMEGERPHPLPVLRRRRAQRDGHHQPTVPRRDLPPGRLLRSRLQSPSHAERPRRVATSSASPRSCASSDRRPLRCSPGR